VIVNDLTESPWIGYANETDELMFGSPPAIVEDGVSEKLQSGALVQLVAAAAGAADTNATISAAHTADRAAARRRRDGMLAVTKISLVLVVGAAFPSRIAPHPGRSKRA
jgi:hypothetical protein